MIISLTELYPKQAILNKRIKDQHNLHDEDVFLNQVLAPLVEIGEASNESRHFKFWSKDQEPRRQKVAWPHGAGGPPSYADPLLEEFVDMLHFGLDLGLEMGYHLGKVKAHVGSDLTTHTLLLAKKVIEVAQAYDKSIPKSILLERYESMMEYLLGLGLMYGFDQKKITEGYKDKFKINMSRQNNGY
ncbi:dUTP diphosphatase [Thalassobacillus sp. C254]|uniref:dUTP diphosphatase n=1 Tax=Thalassobacillus sp. C254 TaxID=1225341 RepID=UPI0006CFE15D|nr:dUTP diphosphatase [Thalassobacillus sp. C254]